MAALAWGEAAAFAGAAVAVTAAVGAVAFRTSLNCRRFSGARGGSGTDGEDCEGREEARDASGSC